MPTIEYMHMYETQNDLVVSEEYRGMQATVVGGRQTQMHHAR